MSMCLSCSVQFTHFNFYSFKWTISNKVKMQALLLLWSELQADRRTWCHFFLFYLNAIFSFIFEKWFIWILKYFFIPFPSSSPALIQNLLILIQFYQLRTIKQLPNCPWKWSNFHISSPLMRKYLHRHHHRLHFYIEKYATSPAAFKPNCCK